MADADRVGSQVLLGDAVLALACFAIDHGDPICLGVGSQATSEVACHSHQVVVVQLLVAASVQLPPPGPEAARAVAHPEVGVEDDPVHAVVDAGQQVAVPLAEVIGHPRTVDKRYFATARRGVKAARRAPAGFSLDARSLPPRLAPGGGHIVIPSSPELTPPLS